MTPPEPANTGKYSIGPMYVIWSDHEGNSVSVVGEHKRSNPNLPTLAG